MTGLAFLVLTRDTGVAACDLCADIAALARPGDRVVIVDDGGDAANAAWTGRFVVAQGFGAGVALDRIVTGARGAGDLGIAANLALAQAAADPTISHAVILPGRARLAGPCSEVSIGAAFRAARVLAEAQPDAVVLAAAGLASELTPPPPSVSAGWGGARPDAVFDPVSGLVSGHVSGAAVAPLSALGRLILPWRLFAGPDALRADEGWAAGGFLGLAWRAQSGSGPQPGRLLQTAPFALLPADPPGPDWCRAAAALVRRTADDPALARWLWAGISAALCGTVTRAMPDGIGITETDMVPGLLSALTPGAALALVAPLVLLARDCPPPAGPGLVAQALRAADPASALRAALIGPATGPATPALTGRAPLQVACLGRHVRRMPLAYPALAPGWDGRIRLTDPAGADLILFAHPQDPATLPATTVRTLPGRTLALLSEEPFWDSLFSPDPLAAAITLPVAHLGPARLHQINHHTSAIFAFDRLPYQPLTDARFSESYARLFGRNAALGPDDWQARFAACPLQAAFMAERRPEAFHDVTLPGGDVTGLCAWRTRLAEGYATGNTLGNTPGHTPEKTPGQVARFGASWQGGPTRFELTDWHAAKLDQLDGQARLISAIENTHQPAYLSEKLFDAFACGGRPLYLASAGHRAHDLGLPPRAWINLHGLTSAEAPAAIDAQPWDAAFMADYARAQARLAALWSDSALITAERARIGRAVLAELARLAEMGPAPG